MKFRELPAMWLRQKAEELRSNATAQERAYTGERAVMCRRVGAAYRRAATVLDEEATAMEDEAK